MKLVDNKLAEQETTIGIPNQAERWEKKRTELSTKISHLESTISDLQEYEEELLNEVRRQSAVISDLKQANEYLKGDSNND